MKTNQPHNQSAKRNPLMLAIATALIASPSGTWAKGEVTAISTSTSPATASTYTEASQTYNWGQGNNLVLESLTYGLNTYEYRTEADRVVLRQNTNINAGNNACSLFAETNGSDYNYNASYPVDGSGQCDMASVIAGNIINVGVVDLFSNDSTNAKDIERVDFIFDGGITAPYTSLELEESGHIVTEKNGNNEVKIAAILSLDGSGNPASFGAPVTVNPNGTCATGGTCYGMTGVSMDFNFLHTTDKTANDPTFTGNSTEQLGIAFVTLADLGIAEGETYYGFSYIASDVGDTDDLVDYMSFPTTTSQGGAGNADLYGGTAGYFISSALNRASGVVFSDSDGDSTKDSGESAIGNLTLALYKDTDSSGTFDSANDTLLGSVDSATDGSFRTGALADGTYFLVPDDADTDFPTGATADPFTLTLAGSPLSALEVPVTPAPTGTVNAINDSVTTLPATSVSKDVAANDTGTGLTVTITSGPTHGTATLSGTTITYTPAAGFTGTDTITYSATDGINSDTATLRVTVGGDHDGDGIADANDLDDDNDGILDSAETGDDFDGDGIPNWFDLDSDDDGIPDIQESGLKQSTKDALDSDFDGTFDSSVAFGANGLANAIETGTESGDVDYDGDSSADAPVDTDGDGAPDFLDLDADGDEALDITEAGLVDADGNGMVDSQDTTDGWADAAETAYASGSGVLGNNDYLVCEPLILTGLEGGVGSLGFLLAPLGAGAWMRRRQRKSA